MYSVIRRFVIAGLFFTLLLLGCASPPPKPPDAIYQYSTINALLEGIYDSDVQIGELAKHGDFGIGTFEGLNGEMIALSGVFYQIDSDGEANIIPDTVKTPFAVVTFFHGVNVNYPLSSLDLQGLSNYMDGLILTKNIFYAIRIDGTFKQVKTRSVKGQKKPYPRLVDALKKQPEFELKNVRGTLVGFRFPPYMGNINVPGYHLHFITADKAAGGHVLALQTDKVGVRIAAVQEFHMVLPRNKSFYDKDMAKEKKAELDKAEKSGQDGSR